ncbi:hypothetical protein Esi_0230_0023 [Ectocarpus siliculosus]|uniref:Uncharacterized protein n=1 Tax=Ectocarpus siliculosus TaxID=2880 RepID=D7FSA8_ECTSI|nr:hypothetical protein Esi_0230_0023 [Ectocarpus siliculosus]|eukprot:CBJ31049.1 hypothetical protein Esi_0230_0023 [Ectocarpus siliculosus]
MLRAIDENEWCSDLRGAVMLRLASESGFMLASRADIDKGKTERESRKVSYKSSAFHLILPFMAYFKDLRLTEIKCDEHSLLTMVGHMWGAYDEERGISCAEMDKEVPVFLPPMKCTTYRVAREAMHTNLVSALQVVTNRYTDGNGNARKEITSDYILETMQAEIDKQSELAMRGLGRAMFSKGLPPARHSRPAGPGEIMENMTYMDVYGCQPTAPYHLPFADTREKSPLALKT